MAGTRILWFGSFEWVQRLPKRACTHSVQPVNLSHSLAKRAAWELSDRQAVSSGRTMRLSHNMSCRVPTTGSNTVVPPSRSLRSDSAGGDCLKPPQALWTAWSSDLLSSLVGLLPVHPYAALLRTVARHVSSLATRGSGNKAILWATSFAKETLWDSRGLSDLVNFPTWLPRTSAYGRILGSRSWSSKHSLSLFSRWLVAATSWAFCSFSLKPKLEENLNQLSQVWTRCRGFLRMKLRSSIQTKCLGTTGDRSLSTLFTPKVITQFMAKGERGSPCGIPISVLTSVSETHLFHVIHLRWWSHWWRKTPVSRGGIPQGSHGSGRNFRLNVVKGLGEVQRGKETFDVQQIMKLRSDHVSSFCFWASKNWGGQGFLVPLFHVVGLGPHRGKKPIPTRVNVNRSGVFGIQERVLRNFVSLR